MSTEVHVVGQDFDFTHLRRKLNPKETSELKQKDAEKQNTSIQIHRV